MNEYKEILKHFGIKPGLMMADMRSRLPDSEKPMFVSICKEFKVCERVKKKGAVVVMYGTVCMTSNLCRSGAKNTIRTSYNTL